ncbi:MAG: DNA-protecting protein DprA [Bacteroidales bacterium]|nr:DNA-protecting protein DprA [Bacteroidales bacterium]
MELKDIIILTQVKGIGPAFFKKNRSRLIYSDDCKSFIKEVNEDALSEYSVYENFAEKVLSDCDSFGIKPISCLSSEYPRLLLEINDPPAVLFIKGNETLLNKVVAIIGTRHSTPLGDIIAERLGEHFSQEYAICNGLVEGIDEHSVYYNGKITPKAIGIISGGLNYTKTCSKAHAKIIDDVLNAGGLIVSEYPPQQLEDKYSGSKASRIQAALSQGLILVQSGINGGSKYTLATFSKLPRVLGVIHFPSSEEYQSEEFEANRVIISEQKEGVAKFVGLKTTKKIELSYIVPIQGKADYDKFSSKIEDIFSQSSFF